MCGRQTAPAEFGVEVVQDERQVDLRQERMRFLRRQKGHPPVPCVPDRNHGADQSSRGRAGLERRADAALFVVGALSERPVQRDQDEITRLVPDVCYLNPLHRAAPRRHLTDCRPARTSREFPVHGRGASATLLSKGSARPVRHGGARRRSVGTSLARLSRLVPDDHTNRHNYRPDYGFARFDELMAQLKQRSPNHATYAAVVTALEEGGRDLDLDALAATHDLNAQARRLVRQLVHFGNADRRPFYAFASVCIAMISPRGRSAESPTTYIMVSRRRGQLDYWWIDSADSGFGALGRRNQPLTLREVAVIVKRVMRTQARWDTIDGADRTAYAPDRAAQLRIHSPFYLQLEGQFRESTESTGRRRRRSRGRRAPSE